MAVLYVKLADGIGIQSFRFRTLRGAREAAKLVLEGTGIVYAIAIRDEV
jgi:hypothetical protein